MECTFDADFASDSLPPEAVIELKPEVLEPSSRFVHSFYCKISTFVLFRAFNITLEFGSGDIKRFYVHSSPNPYEELDTPDYNISGAIKLDSERASKVWINVSSYRRTSITCSAAFVHNMSWASARRSVESACKRHQAIDTLLLI